MALTTAADSTDHAARTPGRIAYDWPGDGCRVAARLDAEQRRAQPPYDVAIIGAGVIGCALAYVLSQYRLRLVVIDKAFDIGEGTSKGNSAIVHTGFDAVPGSLESELVTSAAHQWPDLAQRLKIPFSPVGAVMLALNDEQYRQLPKLKDKALANGVDDVHLLTSDDVRRLEPHVSPHVLGGLHVPRESIADPFTTSVAYAEVALRNGADFLLGVTILRVDDAQAPVKRLVAAKDRQIAARFIINAAGFGTRALTDSYGGDPLDLNPRRGQFVVYDRCASECVQHILLPIPTEKTKGMLVAPTIFGNVLAGPTAEDLPANQVRATQTTSEGLRSVRESGTTMVPALAHQPIIASYAGLRCNCAQGSYQLRFNDGHRGMVTLSGIRSTGFTASITTAQYVAKRMNQECGLPLEPREGAVDYRPTSQWPGWFRPPADVAERIKARSDYGQTVCSCENISAGDIDDAMSWACGQPTLDGLKRRTRALTGRCQGFCCGVAVAEMISRRYDIPLDRVTRAGPGTEFIVPQTTRAMPRRRSTTCPTIELRDQYQVIIIGGGPAGIGTAIGLHRRGVQDVLIVEREAQLGGIPGRYRETPHSVPTFVSWPQRRIVVGEHLAAWMKQQLSTTAVQVALNSQVIGVNRQDRAVTLINPCGRTTIRGRVVVFACGARERTLNEQGWVTGDRRARLFFTMHLLQLMDGCDVLPLQRPLIVGSDLVAFSAAAKLKAMGAIGVSMTDGRPEPAASWLARWYFRRWCRPEWQAAASSWDRPRDLHDSILLASEASAHDGVVVCGGLIPNSELAVAAGLEVRMPDRIPVRHGSHRLSDPNWFVVGAESVGFLSAAASYRDGQRAAREILQALRRTP